MKLDIFKEITTLFLIESLSILGARNAEPSSHGSRH